MWLVKFSTLPPPYWPLSDKRKQVHSTGEFYSPLTIGIAPNASMIFNFLKSSSTVMMHQSTKRKKKERIMPLSIQG